jgi:hypothetical protein
MKPNGGVIFMAKSKAKKLREKLAREGKIESGR